jgi:type IV pilus assembly protein PilC
MREQVDAGESLSAAMEKSGVFPDYAVKMIHTGENSGHLENILFRLSRYYAERKTVADKLKNAVTYPAAMLILIILVLAAMLTLVLPSFREVYEAMSGSLAASSYGYITWAYAVCWIALGVMTVLALALLIGTLLWKTGRRKPVEAVLRKIPITAKILESMGMFRFTDALGTFLASGKMQDEAVLDSIPMTDCAPVEEKLQKVVRSMEEGHGISQAALDADLFEPLYGRMLLAGERSGNLESVLGRLADHLEQNCSDLVDRLVSVVDPLLSGVLMVTVGLSLLSVMLPLIGMMSSVG